MSERVTTREHIIILEKKVDKIFEKLENIEKQLYGNGSIGLFERVRSLEKLKKLPSVISWILNFTYTGILVFLIVKKGI